MAVSTVITRNSLIDLIDLLQAGSIACEATAMASEAIHAHEQRDAVAFLARDVQNTIEAARQKLQEWVDASKEGNGHG